MKQEENHTKRIHKRILHDSPWLSLGIVLKIWKTSLRWWQQTLQFRCEIFPMLQASQSASAPWFQLPFQGMKCAAFLIPTAWWCDARVNKILAELVIESFAISWSQLHICHALLLFHQKYQFDKNSLNSFKLTKIRWEVPFFNMCFKDCWGRIQWQKRF